MYNSGTAAFPRWTCRPCNGSRKAIEHQARSDKVLKAALTHLKKSDPDLWRAKVRACRIRDANDPEGVSGLLDWASRKNFINHLKVEITQKIAVRDIIERKPMGKKQFIAFLRFSEGEDNLDRQEGQDKAWAKVLTSPDTTILEGHGESAVILVSTGRSIQGIRERSYESSITRMTAP